MGPFAALQPASAICPIESSNGTDEQFFLENLTLVNINSSPAEELAGVLGVSDDVAQEIIARRERQPFAILAQVRANPAWMPRGWTSARAGFFSDWKLRFVA